MGATDTVDLGLDPSLFDVDDIEAVLRLRKVGRPPKADYKAKEDAVLRHFGEGVSYKQLARELCVTDTAVYTWCQKALNPNWVQRQDAQTQKQKEATA